MEEMRIITKGNRITTRKYLFKKKAEFHRQQARLSFEEKIRLLLSLQKIANEIKSIKT